MNRLYDAARQRYLQGEQDWRDGVWDVYLVDDLYLFDPSHTSFVADVPAESVVASGLTALDLMTSLRGVAGSTDATFGRVLAWPRPVIAMLIVNRGTDALEWFGDTGFGMPFTPDGSEVVLKYDRAVGGFFVL